MKLPRTRTVREDSARLLEEARAEDRSRVLGLGETDFPKSFRDLGVAEVWVDKYRIMLAVERGNDPWTLSYLYDPEGLSARGLRTSNAARATCWRGIYVFEPFYEW